MKFVEWIKNLLFTAFGWNPKVDELPMLEEQKQQELQPLSAYEVRRPEIAGSSEVVEGIFYIYKGQLIPDHYSECLVSDKGPLIPDYDAECPTSTQNPRREAMYHQDFFPNYMMRKFDDLPGGEKSIPRGRVFRDMLMIDACFARDVDLLRQIKELYRLPDGFTISTSRDYCCPKCFSTVQNTYLSWRDLTAQVG